MSNTLIKITAENLNQYLMRSPRSWPGGPVQSIKCRDGSALSVQASISAYCYPRNNSGPWTHVEVMVSSDDNPVYFSINEGNSGIASYVPIESVAEEILARGNALLTW